MFGKKLFLTGLLLGLFIAHSLLGANTSLNAPIDFSKIKSPIVLRGDSKNAYRDPAALYHAGKFHLFFTLVRTDSDGLIYSYTALSTSSDLQNFSTPKIITPKGQHMNFSSPGNVVRFAGQWILCLQTYPRLNYRRGEKLRWADQTARLFIMRSKDLIHWSGPELLRVKGPDVPVDKMGRMIDPYLIEDKDNPGKWWCFYKQRGVSLSWSYDLKNWTYFGRADSGENVCVLIDRDEYVLFHSPANGIGIKRSKDLKKWRDVNGLITLGQKQWPWAQNRITAGVVLDLRKEPRVGKYVMFFHGGGPGKNKTQDNVDANCSLGIAWSNDLKTWNYPGKIPLRQTAQAILSEQAAANVPNVLFRMKSEDPNIRFELIDELVDTGSENDVRRSSLRYELTDSDYSIVLQNALEGLASKFPDRDILRLLIKVQYICQIHSLTGIDRVISEFAGSPSFDISHTALRTLVDLKYRLLRDKKLPRLPSIPVEEYFAHICDKDGIAVRFSDSVLQKNIDQRVSGQTGHTALSALRHGVKILNYSSKYNHALFVEKDLVHVVLFEEAYAMWDDWLRAQSEK